jgi:hypothetical protein
VLAACPSGVGVRGVTVLRVSKALRTGRMLDVFKMVYVIGGKVWIFDELAIESNESNANLRLACPLWMSPYVKNSRGISKYLR